MYGGVLFHSKIPATSNAFDIDLAHGGHTRDLLQNHFAFETKMILFILTFSLLFKWMSFAFDDAAWFHRVHNVCTFQVQLLSNEVRIHNVECVLKMRASLYLLDVRSIIRAHSMTELICFYFVFFSSFLFFSFVFGVPFSKDNYIIYEKEDYAWAMSMSLPAKRARSIAAHCKSSSTILLFNL